MRDITNQLRNRLRKLERERHTHEEPRGIDWDALPDRPEDWLASIEAASGPRAPAPNELAAQLAELHRQGFDLYSCFPTIPRPLSKNGFVSLPESDQAGTDSPRSPLLFPPGVLPCPDQT